MSKFAKTVLLVAVAFFALAQSVTAIAGKPSKLQVLTSPPLYAWGYKCSAVNYTDSIVDVSFGVFRRNGLKITSVTDDPVPSGHVSGPSGISSPVDQKYCIVTWTGGPDDIRASFCGWQDGVDFQLEGYGATCLELR